MWHKNLTPNLVNKFMSHLLEFYGKECSHCIEMIPLIKRLRKEGGFVIKQYEVWHNKENAKLMNNYDKGYCGGVPFFMNTKTKKWICGAVSYKELKAWALGKQMKVF